MDNQKIVARLGLKNPNSAITALIIRAHLSHQIPDGDDGVYGYGNENPHLRIEQDEYEHESVSAQTTEDSPEE